MKFFFKVFAFIALFALACEKLPNPYDGGGTTSDRKVLLELFTTANDMQNCEQANRAADQLMADTENMYKLTVIQWHPATDDSLGGDTTQTRFTYYGITSMPTAIFDGLQRVRYSSNQYNDYFNAMDTRQKIPTIITLRLTGSVRAGGDVNATIDVKSPPGTGNFTFYMILVEDAVAYKDKQSGKSYTFNCVARDTFSYYLGDDTKFVAGLSKTISHTFGIDKTWNREKMRVVSFVQNNRSDYKEILQTAVTLN
jgi:hypothetical protein